jgi:hypothetical protein
MIASNLQSSDHGANCEEAEDFGSNDAAGCELRIAHASEALDGGGDL